MMEAQRCWRCEKWVGYLLVDPMFSVTDKLASLCEDCAVDRVNIALGYRKQIRGPRAA